MEKTNIWRFGIFHNRRQDATFVSAEKASWNVRWLKRSPLSPAIFVEGDTHKCTQNDANTIWINQERAYCQGFNIWFVLLRLMTSELRSRLGRPRQDQGPLSYRSIEGSRRERGDEILRSLVSWRIPTNVATSSSGKHSAQIRHSVTA